MPLKNDRDVNGEHTLTSRSASLSGLTFSLPSNNSNVNGIHQKLVTQFQANPSEIQGNLQGRRWLVALVVSLIAHILFWQFRAVLETAEIPKSEGVQSLNVTLIPVPSKSNAVQNVTRAEVKATPAEVIKPKAVPKPKALPPKPDAKRVEHPAPVKETESKISESQEQAPAQDASAPPGAPSAPGPTAAETPSGHYEGPRLNADYLHNPRPDYPTQAKRQGWEGRVVLKVVVLEDGAAGSVSIAKSSGHELLDEAAVEAVQRWKFVPAKRDGKPVTSTVNVPINFNLKNE